MKRLLTIITAMAAFVLNASAQTENRKAYEWDGTIFNCFGGCNMESTPMIMWGLEGRYRFRQLPSDIGLGLSLAAPFVMDRVADEDEPAGTQWSYCYWIAYTSFDYKFMSPKQFGKNGCHTFEPYIGIALGGGQSITGTFMGFDEKSLEIIDHESVAIANLTFRAGFKIDSVRYFFEQHFNTDKARGSYLGVTFVF